MIRLRPYGPAPDTSPHPPLLAIPGIDGSAGSIAPIVEHLARRRAVVVADYRGEENGTLDELAAEIGAAARAALPGPWDLLGQSLGTIAAARIAGDAGTPVRKVVLIGTFTRLRRGALRIGNAVTALTPRPVYHLTAVPLMALVCGPVGDGWHHPFFAAVRTSDPAGVIKRTDWEIGRDFGADLRRLDAPCLVLMGARDRFVPDVDREIAALRALFADRPAGVVAIPDAGHVLLPTAAIARAVGEIEGFLS